MRIHFNLNGKAIAVDAPVGTSALSLLRDYLGLKGTKEGCGIGECGACAIEVDGKAVNACLMFAAQLDGRTVLTVEGLETPSGLHPIQEAFRDHHAVQCGYCTPGLLMSTHALLAEKPHPDHDDINTAISGHLCRCTGYKNIVSAIEAAGKNPGGKN
ncbi:MAG: (2Fe-2S)-binding protein [Deltaproteobacteria bacterium]|nr:MAG: (2Fe-2S)-binding protein [Deltaproteobacteria bacterium]RUA01999.1 MAG: (2Fe-2S)-binding protein [Deltaproteobacteria bacterium]